MVDETLRAELVSMMEREQAIREELMSALEKFGGNAPETQAIFQRMYAIDQRNQERLRQIIGKHGWPERSAVGEDGARAAFLIVQHAGPEMRKEFFPSLRQAAENGEASKAHVALMVDRMLTDDGKPQLYGSQLQRNLERDCWELMPIEDEANVDKRRAEMGLEPLAEHLKRFGLDYRSTRSKGG